MQVDLFVLLLTAGVCLSVWLLAKYLKNNFSSAKTRRFLYNLSRQPVHHKVRADPWCGPTLSSCITPLVPVHSIILVCHSRPSRNSNTAPVSASCLPKIYKDPVRSSLTFYSKTAWPQIATGQLPALDTPTLSPGPTTFPPFNVLLILVLPGWLRTIYNTHYAFNLYLQIHWHQILNVRPHDLPTSSSSADILAAMKIAPKKSSCKRIPTLSVDSYPAIPSWWQQGARNCHQHWLTGVCQMSAGEHRLVVLWDAPPATD